MRLIVRRYVSWFAVVSVTVVFGLFLRPHTAAAITCGFGTDIGGGQCRGYLTSGTSWSVPSDWNNSSNHIEAIGGGGASSNLSQEDPFFYGGHGGGGGAYARADNVALSGTISYSIGTGGSSARVAGGDTSFNSTTALAKGASAIAGDGSSGAGGVGGAAASCRGGVGGGTLNPGAPYAHSGGNGGTSSGAGQGGASGGGGAGGLNGNGNNGGSGLNDPGKDGGSGDAGSGGTGGTGASNFSNGGTGGTGTEWDSTHGSGGGGGGGGVSGGNGGQGGLYGGGGGGAGASSFGTFGSGRQGLIVITYSPVLPSAGRDLTVNDSVSVSGDVTVVSNLSKGSGTFMIDDPTDPANSLLYHSFVESTDALNQYAGTAIVGKKGEVTIHLPSYFEALNGDYQYFVRPIDAPMPGLYVKDEVRNNKFVVAGGVAGKEISWMVTGVRRDPYILANPIIAEVDKGPGQLVDVGEYLSRVMLRVAIRSSAASGAFWHDSGEVSDLMDNERFVRYPHKCL